MRIMKVLILVFVFCVMSFYSVNTFAQSQQNFSIDSVPKSELRVYAAKSESLDAHLLCMAGVRSDVSLCEYAYYPEGCRSAFKALHGFYRELTMTKTVTSTALDSMLSSGNMTFSEMGDYAKGFVDKDAAICSKLKSPEDQRDCKARILRSTQSCSSRDCVDEVYYIKAIEEKNAGLCNNIKEENIKMLCKGDVTSEEDECKQCNGFKKFADQYKNKIKEGR